VTDRPSPKLEVLRFGPFKVEHVTGPLTYQLEVPKDWKVNRVFHRSKLHPVAEDHIPERENPITLPTNVTIREGQDINQASNGSQSTKPPPCKNT